MRLSSNVRGCTYIDDPPLVRACEEIFSATVCQDIISLSCNIGLRGTHYESRWRSELEKLHIWLPASAMTSAEGGSMSGR